LAKDDLAAAKKAASALAAVTKDEKQMSLAEHATEIASSDSLITAREHFKMASQEAEKLGRARKVTMCSPVQWQRRLDPEDHQSPKPLHGAGDVRLRLPQERKKAVPCPKL